MGVILLVGRCCSLSLACGQTGHSYPHVEHWHQILFHTYANLSSDLRDPVSLILPLMMVFSMELAAGAPVELGLSLLLLIVNCILSSSDVASVKGWLSANFLEKADLTVQAEAPSKPRVDEAMQKLTEENFLIASHFLQHAMLLAVIMYVGMGSPAFAGLCFLFYAAFLLIAKGYVRMTSSRVKAYLIVNYITIIPVMFAGDLFAAVGRKDVLDQLKSGYRFVLVVLCVDSNLHIPSQVTVSVAEAGADFPTG